MTCLTSVPTGNDDMKTPGFDASATLDCYVLRLYVAGDNAQSKRAIANLKQICDTHLAERFELEVVDIFAQPHLAETDRILAVPALIKRLPEPVRRLVGDLSQRDKVLLGLDIDIV